LLAKPLAKKFRNQLKFRTVNIKDYPTVPRWLNFDSNKFPALSILQPARNKKYPLNQDTELSGTTLHTFVEDFINGKLKPTIRSQPVPKTSNSSVIDFVGSNYDDVVLNNDQDVLVEFSAPWCGVCTTFAPDYEQLGKSYSPSNFSRTKVTISKIDISQNDVPDQISALPTFKLFPANSKDSPIVYTGDTTIQDLANFIRDHGFYKIDPYKVDIVNHDIASGAQQVLSGSCDAAGCSYDLFLEKGDRPGMLSLVGGSREFIAYAIFQMTRD
jgi:protein disulfide-isomerase A1